MNDLGLTLAWLAVQVTLVLGPALALQAWVSRRRPAAGAWVASASLMAVLVLTAAVFLIPAVQRGRRTAMTAPRSAAPQAIADGAHAGAPAAVARRRGTTFDFASLARAWGRLERGASAPALRVRPWSGTLALASLVGAAFSAVQMVLGLWAVRLCRHRGRPVDDPALAIMLDSLRASMKYPRPVELREVDDLTTPATAGWIRPIILLPIGWRTWSDATRRAVLAHELAHVVRGDFAAGLLARLAVTLNAWHPLVHWMAARLHVQQELAADALGAEHAGGRGCYLRALSQLALEHDGPAPHWPARAFLPRRGLLIRRIRMLRDDHQNHTDSRLWRVLSAIALAALTSAAGWLRGPALADEKPPAPAAAHRPDSAAPLYLRDGMDGVLVIRPRAALGHPGMEGVAELVVAELIGEIEGTFGPGFRDPAKRLKLDPTRPGFLRLELRDIEWVTASVGFGHSGGEQKLHTIMFGNPAIRTVAPFDWLTFFRQWGCEVAEVQTEKGVYHTVKGPLADLFGPHCAVYLPDDRTVVIDDQAKIRKLVGVPATTPAYLRGSDWASASEGLAAIALKNEDNALTKRYDLGRPDDAFALPLFKGVDRWIVSVADADEFRYSATAVCRDKDTSEIVRRAVESLLALARTAVAKPVAQTDGDGPDHTQRLTRALLNHVTITTTQRRAPSDGFPPIDHMVAIRADHCGTLADWADLYAGPRVEAVANDKSAKTTTNAPERSGVPARK